MGGSRRREMRVYGLTFLLENFGLTQRPKQHQRLGMKLNYVCSASGSDREPSTSDRKLSLHERNLYRLITKKDGGDRNNQQKTYSYS